MVNLKTLTFSFAFTLQQLNAIYIWLVFLNMLDRLRTSLQYLFRRNIEFKEVQEIGYKMVHMAINFTFTTGMLQTYEMSQKKKKLHVVSFSHNSPT